MCGIAGCISKNNIMSYLLESLKRVEYRGYDSAGIATLKNNQFNITKSIGNIKNLENEINLNDKSYCGIAHTRWATHGKPSLNNTHPILSNNGIWAVVHNGIIENFEDLKLFLQNKGFKFKGQTDTEVIANLLEYNSANDIMETIIKTCTTLNGSYALLIINKNQPNTIYLAKNKSPLYVCSNSNEILMASDLMCFNKNIKKYYCLNDNEFAVANENNITFYNNKYQKIKKKQFKYNELNSYVSKEKYDHYMIKEIEETPQVLLNIVNRYKKQKILNIFNIKFLSKFNEVILIGCGTAYHSALMGAKLIQEKARIKASAYVASEFRYSNPIISQKTLCILVSQSGETADTLAVCDLVNSLGATTIALTNVEHSTITKKVKYVLPTVAGREIAVASTKAYTAQIAIMYIIASKMKNLLFNQKTRYFENLIKEVNNLSLNRDVYKNISQEIINSSNIFFIGRDKDYVTAEESSLKLKEISYISCSAHPAGELKHGFLALVDDKTILFTIATQKELYYKTLNGAHEAISRGAKVYVITNEESTKNSKNMQFIKINSKNKDLSIISSILIFQYVAYFVSVSKGLNPDQPRNLAKSVTVE